MTLYFLSVEPARVSHNNGAGFLFAVSSAESNDSVGS